mmetsp:Transcript_23687/g.36015  ORF Transcript_23687/g.36015 Transcript_23687/m.36015 type:complete len:331 (+) Transcript_23687:33-1025(+)
MPEEDVGRVYSQRKLDFAERLEGLLKDYAKVLIISADNVGSQQMHVVRAELRNGSGPKAQILMGKNTMIKFIIRRFAASDPAYAPFNKLADLCTLNVGLVFTNDDPKDVRNIVEKNKVTAAAKAGALAPKDVALEAGPTGLEPTQTGFFQALGIATKITKGSIEIISRVQLCTAGLKVGSSEAVLLTKMGMKPFEYGLKVVSVFQEGSVLDPKVLEITDADIVSLFLRAVSNVSAAALSFGYPILPAIPHQLVAGYRNIIALAISTDISFKAAEEAKDMIANPEKYAGSGGGGGGGAAPAAAAAAGGGAAAAKAPEPEEEEEEMAFDLFD